MPDRANNGAVGFLGGYREKLATVIDAFVRLSDTEDVQEGLRAFAEKRPPQWQGR